MEYKADPSCLLSKVLVLVACFAVSFGIQSWIEGGVIAAVIVM